MRYKLSSIAFFLFLGLLLLVLVDIRRGFLFTDYLKVGSPSTLLNLNILQLPVILVAILGIWIGFTFMKKLEKGLRASNVDLKFSSKFLAIAIGIILIADLFTYRGVPASRIISADEMGIGSGTFGVGQAIPVSSFPGWLQPMAEGINYILLVWHATFVGMLLGGLFLIAGTAILNKLKGTGFLAHLAGTAAAIPQPF